MDDLKSVTVSYLRELARKHLGPGHSKLTKKELIAALAQFVPGLKKLAKLAGIELPARSKTASQAAPSTSKSSKAQEAPAMKKKEPEKKAAERKKEPEKKAERKKEPEAKAPEPKKEPAKKAAEPKKEAKAPEPRKEPEKKAAASPGRKAEAPRPAPAKAEDLSASPKPAHVVNFPRRSRSGRAGDGSWEEGAEEAETAALEAEHPHAAEPLVEGFFVARMVGERELRRHHLTEDQAPRLVVSRPSGHEEDLGELPLDYGNDLALALARDPQTLFIIWDFSPASRARAMEGLEDPRAVLRVFDGDKLVREQEFALESRSFYIHGLPAGRPYRVEAHFVGRDGRSRRIGSSTHPITLPRTGLSQDTSVRFMRMPPPPPVAVTGSAPMVAVSSPAPEPRFEEHPEEGVEEFVEESEYLTWRRVPLPGSADLAEVVEARRQRASRRAAQGAGRPEHLEVSLRPPGSSEQSIPGLKPEHLEVPLRPPGSSEQSIQGLKPEYLEVSLRPPGSSEQSSVMGSNRGGASEQTHWTPPPSGRGR